VLGNERSIPLEELETRFVDAAKNQVHPLIVEWKAAASDAALREAYGELLASLTQEGEKAGSRPPDSGLVRASGELFAVWLRGGNPAASSSAEIKLSTVCPGTLGDWTELKANLLEVFADAKPNTALFYHPSHLPLAAKTASIDTHVLAAPARDIAARRQAAARDIALLRSASLDFYPRYKALYEAMYVERPELAGAVRTESKDSLAYCLDHGYLYEIIVDGRWAGVIAAKRKVIAGACGMFMVEIVLAPEVRGLGLGPFVHQQFAQAIAAQEPQAVIIGTISSKNPWSLKTALKSGRIEIGAWHRIGL
jgi:hypothetical protein